jgi:hypothetical protein
MEGRGLDATAQSPFNPALEHLRIVGIHAENKADCAAKTVNSAQRAIETAVHILQFVLSSQVRRGNKSQLPQRCYANRMLRPSP